ncbi:MAG TPA: hypothetical protein DCS43_17130, partial [Verrucomicrobia bacterium]|nr:hypothetical protein [Verrucomicrobiota bacterium]
KDPRYDMEAYIFIREALDFTAKSLDKPRSGPKHHVSGRELSEGFRDLALQLFGPMALKVLNTWGLFSTQDIGELVFNLVDAGELGKTDQDSRADFVHNYDFYESFGRPYEPPALANEPPQPPTLGNANA